MDVKLGNHVIVNKVVRGESYGVSVLHIDDPLLPTNGSGRISKAKPVRVVLQNIHGG